MNAYRFGEKIRRVRERKKMSLKAVSRLAGLSESLISQIERNKISPSLESLLRVMEVLDIDMEYLFRDYKREKRVKIVRGRERNVYRAQSVSYEELSVIEDGKEEHSIEAFFLTIEAGGRRGSEEYGHPGKELGVILSGKAGLEYGKESYLLEEGDSVTFSSDTPHILTNRGDDRLKAIWIITPSRQRYRT